ncbi:hypothetical protein ILUMI_13363 [Ignelater luminosus]|uniref:Uncharacterized protein n=1 Tax=Ignelater luminosus TaxID=2038154 RepID=A0A8K0CWV7_IGNLU|nr:hypothetical protein ILUMI_13363 [Ignelater luminosus]
MSLGAERKEATEKLIRETMRTPTQANNIKREAGTKVQLQALLDLTTFRILMVAEVGLSEITDIHLEDLTLLVKWSCDGSSDQSLYKQNSSEDQEQTDSDMFIISVNPSTPNEEYNTVERKKPLKRTRQESEKTSEVTVENKFDILADENMQDDTIGASPRDTENYQACPKFPKKTTSQKKPEQAMESRHPNPAFQTDPSHEILL